MDCRPEEPRQLVGDDGNSRRRGERSDTEQLSAGSLFGKVISGEMLDAAGDTDCATVDDCFKPKCLGIPSSIRE